MPTITPSNPAQFVEEAQRQYDVIVKALEAIDGVYDGDKVTYPSLIPATTFTSKSERVDIKVGAWSPGFENGKGVLNCMIEGTINGKELPNYCRVTCTYWNHGDGDAFNVYVNGNYSALSDSARKKVYAALIKVVEASGLTVSDLQKWGLATQAYGEVRSLLSNIQHAARRRDANHHLTAAWAAL